MIAYVHFTNRFVLSLLFQKLSSHKLAIPRRPARQNSAIQHCQTCVHVVYSLYWLDVIALSGGYIALLLQSTG